jgi:NADP-dependent 3-hydroxy acid dehydrogenase YdfG
MKVLVTGASSGIGLATAELFAEKGHELTLVARRADRLGEIASRLKARAVPLDVSDRGAVESASWGEIDVLVNAAGLARGLSPVHEDDPRDWDEMLDTNVKGLLAVTRAVLPGMIARRRGHVVNLGSVAGYWVYPKGAVYCASKYAVRAISEGLRMDVHGTGVRVTEISPGMVETEFSAVRLRDSERAKAVYSGMKPLTARDIAETILWCVERPAHVNIQELIVFPTQQSGVGLVDRSGVPKES